MKLPYSIIVISVTAILAACGDTSGYIQVLNDDNTPGNNVETIWVSKDCEDGWGDPDLAGLSVSNGQSAPKIEVDVKPIPEPPQDDIVDLSGTFNTRFNTYDVMVCFSSGFCADKRDIELSDGDTEIIDINDHAGELSPFAGNTRCNR